MQNSSGKLEGEKLRVRGFNESLTTCMLQEFLKEMQMANFNSQQTNHWRY